MCFLCAAVIAAVPACVIDVTTKAAKKEKIESLPIFASDGQFTEF